MALEDEGTINLKPTPEVYEKKVDFETPPFSQTEVSTTLRPDAISFDHKRAFTIGPVNISDLSEGILATAWYVRYKNQAFYLSRVVAGAWEAETLLFSYFGVDDVQEVDIAFTQNGSPVLVVQRLIDHINQIWLYWFDPVLSQSVFIYLCDGRTPRVLLDDPLDVVNSDVQIFYIDDVDDTVKQRQQRDRYEIEYDVPVTNVEHKYLEDVYKTEGNRLFILYSTRDVTKGRYSLARLATSLFPVHIETDSFTASNLFVSGDLILAVYEFNIEDAQFDINSSFVSGLLEFALTQYAVQGDISSAIEILSIENRDILIVQPIDNEMMDFGNTVVSATNVLVVITVDQGVEMMDFGNTVVSGALS